MRSLSDWFNGCFQDSENILLNCEAATESDQLVTVTDTDPDTSHESANIDEDAADSENLEENVVISRNENIIETENEEDIGDGQTASEELRQDEVVSDHDVLLPIPSYNHLSIVSVETGESFDEEGVQQKVRSRKKNGHSRVKEKYKVCPHCESSVYFTHFSRHINKNHPSFSEEDTPDHQDSLTLTEEDDLAVGVALTTTEDTVSEEAENITSKKSEIGSQNDGKEKGENVHQTDPEVCAECGHEDSRGEENDTVKWVLCSQCSSWWHQSCASVTEKIDVTSENFICCRCSEPEEDENEASTPSCPLCQDCLSGTTKSILYRHLSLHHFRDNILDLITSDGGHTERCSLCDYENSQLSTMIQHYGVKHSYVEQWIPPAYHHKLKKRRRNQKSKKDKELKFVCRLCPVAEARKFENRTLLYWHYSTSHFQEELLKKYVDIKNLKCLICGKQNLTQHDLIRHIGSAHRKVDEYLDPEHQVPSIRRKSSEQCNEAKENDQNSANVEEATEDQSSPSKRLRLEPSDSQPHVDLRDVLDSDDDDDLTSASLNNPV